MAGVAKKISCLRETEVVSLRVVGALPDRVDVSPQVLGYNPTIPQLPLIHPHEIVPKRVAL